KPGNGKRDRGIAVKLYTIAVLPGDGIGPEVTGEAVRVLEAAGERFGLRFALNTYAVGAAGVAAAGDPLPAETRAAGVKADAVLLGPVGEPSPHQPPPQPPPGSGLVGLRRLVRRRRRLLSVDKANVLETSQLWRETVTRVAQDYPDITLEHAYVDYAAMRLVTDSAGIDVLLTENMFGDILSDEAAVLAGSLGLLPSASLGDGVGLFEPIHGSAPALAGKDVANPIGAIASAAMLLRYGLGLAEPAAAVEQAIVAALEQGARTRDIARPSDRMIGTREMGAWIAELVRSPSKRPLSLVR